MDRITEYISELTQTLETLPPVNIKEVITILHEARLSGRQIFIMGNGGSASTASHFVCDLSKNTRHKDWPDYKVIGLADNIAVFSAYANDEGYESVFANQLDSLVTSDDIVIGISTSGNSENVINAIELANRRGANTIGITGFDGGRLASFVDIEINVASDCIEQVEDIHLILEHIITKILREDVSQVPIPEQVDILFPKSMQTFRVSEDESGVRDDPGKPSLSERSKASYELFSAINSELALELNKRDLLRRVLQLTLENLEATSGSVVVLNEDGQVVDGTLAYNGEVQSHTPQQFADIVERGLAGWVVKNRQSALVMNTREDPRWLQRSWDSDKNEPRSAISVPLISNGLVVGVLTLVNSQAGKFTKSDLSLLTALAVFVAMVDHSLQ